MFNPFFRPYVPGFRVGLGGVPGFNIDDSSLPPRGTASSEGTLPESAAERYLDAAQTQIPPAISFGLPGAEGWVLSTPLIGSPGFRVSPQEGAPGFNVGPQDEAPNFNLEENGVQQPETSWSYGSPLESVTPQDPNTAQTLAPLPGVDVPALPVLPPLAEWPYQLGTMLPPQLPTAFGPRTGARIEIGPATVQRADQWPPPSSAPQQPPDIDIRSRAATTQNANPQAAAQQAMRNAWFQPPKGGWAYVQEDDALSPIPLVRPLGDSNFSLAKARDAGGQQAQQQVPLQQYQQAQRTIPSAPIGPGLAMVRPGPDQEFSQLIEAYRRLKEAEGKQSSSAWQSLPPPPNENGVSYASGSDGPSLGQRLAQSSIKTIVPGAHYQELARQQLGAGNYVGAGVYQAAALLDAALGVATFGLGTRLAAAGRTAAAEGAALFRRAFDSREQLLRYLGRAPEGMQWHHIVEQSQAAQFGQRPIQSVENVVAIPIEAHRRLNAFYSSKRPIYRS